MLLMQALSGHQVFKFFPVRHFSYRGIGRGSRKAGSLLFATWLDHFDKSHTALSSLRPAVSSRGEGLSRARRLLFPAKQAVPTDAVRTC